MAHVSRDSEGSASAPSQLHPTFHLFLSALYLFHSWQRRQIGLAGHISRMLFPIRTGYKECIIMLSIDKYYPRENQKIHYCVRKEPPPVPILRLINPIHTTPPYYPKIHLILSSHLCLYLLSGPLPSVLSNCTSMMDKVAL
jgi:hypothetical protein